MGWWIIKRPGRRVRIGWSTSRAVGCLLGWLVLVVVSLTLVVTLGRQAARAMDAPARSPAAICDGRW